MTGRAWCRPLTASRGAAALAAVMAAGCGDGPGPTPLPIRPVLPVASPGPPVVQQFSIYSADIDESWVDFTGLMIGGTRTFAAAVKFDDGSSQQVSAAWSTSDERVARIEGEGKFRGVSNRRGPGRVGGCFANPS